MMQEAIRLTPLPTAPDPTRQQQQASDPQTSAWVNASAGSGKTTVLTKRVTRLLLDGVEPQRILCLTFTRAAAAEMALRITRQLSEWATCNDNALNTSLSELQGYTPSLEQMTEARRLFAQVLSCPGGMRIRTIHSFGQEVLRRFPIEAGLPPHFAVIEESDAQALQEGVLMELLQELNTPSDGELSRYLKLLVCDLGERGFAEAMRSVLHERAKIKTTIGTAGSLDKLINRMRSMLELTPDDTEANIKMNACAPDGIADELAIAADALTKGLKTAQEFGSIIKKWLAADQNTRVEMFDEYAEQFFTGKGEFLKKYADKKTCMLYPNAEKVLIREATRLQSVRERLETVHIADITEAVLYIGTELAQRYQTRKKLQAALDYDDLIIETNALMNRPGIAPWVLYKLDGGIEHILVDEAQDTSRPQWNMIQILADEFFAGKSAKDDINRTLFVVGDEKQSIFSFQNADPDAFSEMRQFFKKRITDAEKSYTEIPLSVSFRSAPAVLKVVDAVFANDHARQGVSHDPVAHEAFGHDKIGHVEVWPLLAAPEKTSDAETWPLPLGYEDEHDPQAELAAQIADQISGWVARKEALPGTDAIISPGDIMILLRRRGRFADLMVRALKQRNVAVTGVDRMHLVRQLPVMDLLALIQFALLPEDDLNLATVLRGPLLNVSEDDLMSVAIGRDGTLWRSLQSHPPLSAARDYLSYILARADFMTPITMLTHILNEPCPGSTTSGRQAIWSRLGLDALDPVDELLNAAQNFSRRHAPSLQNFIHWLTVSDSEIKRELDQGAGQVRIMTVHASKGLEAPIVFLPDTTNVPRTQTVPKFLWSATNTPLYLPRRPAAGAARHIWNIARDKQLQEYRRLLYVALTRAANRLYIGGWEMRNEADSDECWYNLIRSALHPLHEPSTAGTDADATLIAFADPILPRAEKKKTVLKEPPKKISLPAWAMTAATTEPAAIRTLAPSHIAAPATAAPDSAYSRGRIIHRLLQSLPDLSPDLQESATTRFLASPQHRLTQAQQDEIKAEIIKLLRHPDFAPIFGPKSRAEVPLIGISKGQKISGQVDRLCLRNDSVWIVDYKTNRPPPINPADVPLLYRTQLVSYRDILQALYPGKPIRCFLLWTYGPRLMEIPDALLNA